MPIRKATCTTNVIESINSVIRKFTRNRKKVSQLREFVEADLHGDPRSIDTLDDPDTEKERGPQSLRDPIQRPNAEKPGLTNLDSRGTQIFTGPCVMSIRVVISNQGIGREFATHRKSARNASASTVVAPRLRPWL